jgi:hypothetical protein
MRGTPWKVVAKVNGAEHVSNIATWLKVLKDD